MSQVRLAIPKGHLGKDTLQFLEEAGYSIYGSDRTYSPKINDEHIVLRILRPQEIPLYVEEGLLDIGITGMDWLRETNADVRVLLDLKYSRVRLVLAVPKWRSEVSSLSELIACKLEERTPLKISTEYLNIAVEMLESSPSYRQAYGNAGPVVITPWWTRGENADAKVILSFGATEAKPLVDADAILEVTETGTSLEQNGLKVIETVMESAAVLIGNKSSLGDSSKKEKISDIITLLQGVVEARQKLHIFLNVQEERLDELLMSLPALKRPTVSKLAEKGWFAINTVIDRKQFLEMIPIIRRLAQGLVVYEPRQVLPLETAMEGGG